MANRKTRYKKAQHKKKLLMQIREDLQLSGVLPTTPDGGLRPTEAVDPSTQSEDNTKLPEIITEAVRNGWEVPGPKKIHYTNVLGEIIEGQHEAKVKVAAFKALHLADKDQYQRDHPEETSKSKANIVVNQNVTNNNVTANVFNDIENRIKLIEATSPVDSAPASDIRQDSAMQQVDEAQSTSTEEEPEAD